MARFFIGGLLTHAPAVLALAAPTTNSYRRLVPGYEAPVNLAFSQRNRSAAVRIPMYSDSPKAKRVEFRPPDPTCNPYLTFSALLMAGLDGIRREILPEKHGFGPIDCNIYEMPAEEKKDIKSVPGSLDDALNALEGDHEFLLEDDVFTTRPAGEVRRDQARAGRRGALAPGAAGVRALLRRLITPSVDAGHTRKGALTNHSGGRVLLLF